MAKFREEVAEKRAYALAYSKTLETFENTCIEPCRMDVGACSFGQEIHMDVNKYKSEYCAGVFAASKEIDEIVKKVSDISKRADLRHINKKVYDSMRETINEREKDA